MPKSRLQSGKTEFRPCAADLTSAAVAFGQAAELPSAEAGAMQRLESSPRHGEWVTVDAGGDRVDAWVVYPERSGRAPDLISGKAPGGKGSRAVSADDARALIAGLDPVEVIRRLNAVAKYATTLPAALPRYAVVGFCWGGGVSFTYATEQPALRAAVVYYGTSPATQALGRITAPVLGLYGGNDARVGATVPPAAQEMKRLGKSFEYTMFDGAGHAFLRQQDGQSGANLKATQQAWPRMIQFLRKNLETGVSLRDDSTPGAMPVTVSLECTCDDDYDTTAQRAFLGAGEY